MIFKDPWITILIPFLLVFIVLFRSGQRIPGIRFPSRDLLGSLGRTWKTRFRGIPLALRLLAVAIAVLALAGPRGVLQETEFKAEGIDIVLLLDASGSMRAQDFQLGGSSRSRLFVAKQVAKEFVEGRKNDQIGLVAFAGVAYTVSPLTTDYGWLKRNLERVEAGLISPDGTAIGSAITSGLARLKNSQAKSKVMILLTDGVNNAGDIPPEEAARAAKAMGIKVYTIGAGSEQSVLTPVRDGFDLTYVFKNVAEIDEATLKGIASATGGKYFRAADTQGLREIYKEIDALEKTKLEIQGYKEYQEMFIWFLLAAVAALAAEFFLSNTLFFRIP
ncbi:MAG: VWA domain-containing protein [Candidatus Omnitrophota bacterium]|nr:VWA domain-containing protein [Candidatus Omnitrophota bacterium]MDZ4243378.1 VWA domain-containing protein [Candidatus Omnitrophota bacterium]